MFLMFSKIILFTKNLTPLITFQHLNVKFALHQSGFTCLPDSFFEQIYNKLKSQ